jgi:hypothetical protein
MSKADPIPPIPDYGQKVVFRKGGVWIAPTNLQILKDFKVDDYGKKVQA